MGTAHSRRPMRRSPWDDDNASTTEQPLYHDQNLTDNTTIVHANTLVYPKGNLDLTTWVPQTQTAPPVTFGSPHSAWGALQHVPIQHPHVDMPHVTADHSNNLTDATDFHVTGFVNAWLDKTKFGKLIVLTYKAHANNNWRSELWVKEGDFKSHFTTVPPTEHSTTHLHLFPMDLTRLEEIRRLPPTNRTTSGFAAARAWPSHALPPMCDHPAPRPPFHSSRGFVSHV
jgi:hypothetical protein